MGELSASVLLTGKFESCSESVFSNPPGAKEDPASSVIYQFDVMHIGVVKLDVDGLGESMILRKEILEFRAGELVASVNRRFEAGRYTLIGRAPLCGNVKENWNGGYKILIDLLHAEDPDANALETVDRTGEIVVLTREERPVLRRVGRWSFIVSMSLLMASIMIIALALSLYA